MEGSTYRRDGLGRVWDGDGWFQSRGRRDVESGLEWDEVGGGGWLRSRQRSAMGYVVHSYRREGMSERDSSAGQLKMGRWYNPSCRTLRGKLCEEQNKAA